MQRFLINFFLKKSAIDLEKTSVLLFIVVLEQIEEVKYFCSTISIYNFSISQKKTTFAPSKNNIWIFNKTLVLGLKKR